MNGIERITERIESDAQAEIGQILADARKTAEGITVRYRAEAAAETASLEEENRRAAAERRNQLLRAARLEGRKMRLAARQSMVERAYAMALERLCSLPKEQYVTLLTRLLEEASVTGEEEVFFSAGDRQKAGKAAVERFNREGGRHLRIAEETRPIRGGFILRDGQVEVNCAVETLLRMRRAETVGEVAALLFGNTGGGS